MKIVHINTNDSGGGAAIACRRCCEAMISIGIESKMIVSHKKSDISFIMQFRGKYFSFLVNRFINRCIAKYIKNLDSIGEFSYMYPGISFNKCKDIIDADIIVIHWVNNGVMSINGLEKILKLGKPTYWYMHDMFPITGGCHHSMGCEGFTSTCSGCKILKNKLFPSFCNFQHQQKIKHLSKFKNLIFVAPSFWLTNLTIKSTVARNNRVMNIPNVIDTNFYKPKASTKNKFGLNPNKYTILVGNASLDSPYKGMRYTYDCLKHLDSAKYEILVFGGALNSNSYGIDVKVVSVGFVDNEIEMVDIYNACDIFLITSVAENYPNVVLEAMACGKPCVGFSIGGIPDLIKHKQSGFLSNDYSTQTLVEGVEWCLSNNHYLTLSKSARNQVIMNNDYSKIKSYFNIP